ncbi:hypothetical protein [Citrobacter pasteurii]|nr:hypothetical protein [Citrobacter pasteurii]
MTFSLCRFLDTLPPIAVSREGDQSAYGQAGSLWGSLLNARTGRRSAKTKKRAGCAARFWSYAVARSFQESE